MWILSDDLIITCLPQQWDAPRDDHLNVLEGIIKDIKNRSKETVPVRSVIDLACIISSRCIDAIESRVVKEKDYPFLDKFESTVSSIDQQVDELFRQFNVDSRQASEWLKRQRVRSHPSPNPSDDDLNITGDPDEPECVDRLLDINPETKLLDQIQSLRDEFQLLTSVLSSQTWGVNEFLEKLRISPQETKELNSYASEQLATIRTHLSDIDRMQAQTNAIHASITNLLDLKQRYANVFEARFARYQATDTVHQGQTIMVFTIVTVIFLPLSFIGSLFTINISDFPQGPDGEPSMSFAFVAKWVFGIGFAISVPLVLLALSYESMTRAARERKRRIWAKWRGRKVRGTTAATTTTAPLKEADWKEVVDATAVAPQVDHEDWQEIRRAAPRDSWTMTMYKGFRRKRRFGAFAGERGV
jgi:Mg2+ and Co2+ transporter CorA